MKYEFSKQAFDKQAGPYSDILISQAVGPGLAAAANTVHPALGTLVNLPGTVGSLAALAKKSPSEAEEQEYDDNPAWAGVPGVGAYRTTRRWKRQVKDSNGEYPHGYSQVIGPVTSTLLSVLLGTGIGGVIGAAKGGKENINKGIVAGAITGGGAAGVANIVGAIAAALTKTRSRGEQQAYADSGTASEYLVPGVSTYNNYKTMGRSHADAVEREKA